MAGDGCSAVCTIEAGYQCQGGGFIDRDLCWEICGAGSFDLGNYECDDGNNVDGDGCDANCR